MRYCESQGIRNADETQHGEVAFTMLNLTEVRGSQTCLGSQHFVGQTLLFPVLTEGRPKQVQQHIGVVWRKGRCGLMGYRRLFRLSGSGSITDCGRSKKSVRVQS